MTHESSQLAATARELVAEGKGILAADESTSTMTKRLEGVGVESTEETRRWFRELLFTTEGAEDFISGVILFDETIRQSTADGTPFPEALAARGVIPGIKVDQGAKPLAGAPGREGHGGARRPARARWPSTASSARASRSGARSSPSASTSRAPTASTRTPTRWPATPRCARRPRSSRSSSRRC